MLSFKEVYNGLYIIFDNESFDLLKLTKSEVTDLLKSGKEINNIHLNSDKTDIVYHDLRARMLKSFVFSNDTIYKEDSYVYELDGDVIRLMVVPPNDIHIYIDSCVKCYNDELFKYNDKKKLKVSGGTSLFSFARLFSYGKFEYLDISDMTSKCKDLFQAFNFCLYLKEINFGNFDTSLVCDMTETFNNCRSLEVLDLSSFNTSSVRIMNATFRSCSGLVSLKHNFNTDNVSDLNSTFYGCTALESLDLSSCNFYKVRTMDNTFRNCIKLHDLKINKPTLFDFITYSGTTFVNCCCVPDWYNNEGGYLIGYE